MSASLFVISALRNLLRNSRRTVAVVATVACGTGVIYLYHGFNTGIMNQYRENAVHAFAGHGIVELKGYHGQSFERPWEHWIEAPGGAEARLASIKGVTHVFPRVSVTGLLTNGQLTAGGRGVGVDGPRESGFFTTLNIEQGKAFTAEPDGILLGAGLARALDARPGAHLTFTTMTVDGTMNAADFTVSGVFHTGNKFIDDNLFRIQLARAQELLATERIESFGIGLADTWGWAPVAAEIRRDLPALEPTSYEEIDRMYYGNAVKFLDGQYRVMQFIIFSIVVMGILSTITASVLERKQELGTCRANGESKWDVIRLLLVEAAALGALGGVFGAVLAQLVVHVLIPNGILMPTAPGLTRQFYVRIELQTAEALRAFVLGVVACAAGTVLAGLKVTRLSIAEALRSA